MGRHNQLTMGGGPVPVNLRLRRQNKIDLISTISINVAEIIELDGRSELEGLDGSPGTQIGFHYRSRLPVEIAVHEAPGDPDVLRWVLAPAHRRHAGHIHARPRGAAATSGKNASAVSLKLYCLRGAVHRGRRCGRGRAMAVTVQDPGQPSEDHQRGEGRPLLSVRMRRPQPPGRRPASGWPP